MFRIKIFHVLILSSLGIWSAAQQTLVAKFNMGGIKGTVTFTQSSVSTPVDVVLNLQGLQSGRSHQLELHEFPVDYDTKQRCTISAIGKKLGGEIPNVTSGLGSAQTTGIDLSGATSIEGRSFLLTDNADVTACATVEADEEYITAFAHLPANLGGTLIFRQRAGNSAADTIIYYKLYHTVDDKPQDALKWQINSGMVAMDISAHTAIANRCGSSVGELYNPTGISGSGCTNDSQISCRVGDLTGKHGQIALLSEGTTSGFFPDLNLPLSGTNSVIGKTIIFLNADSYYACANIVEFPAMSATSKFSNDGVKGHISFNQKSPYDVTTVHVELENLDNRGGGYHVHNWPVPQRIQKGDMLCSPDDVSGHLNPFNIDINSPAYPAPGSGTPDQYEIGDISGKFGMLDGMASYNFTYYDPNLPMFGVNSIVGRSMVIHKNLPGGPRWICSTIWADYNMLTAVVTFKYPVIGHMVFRQMNNSWYAETQIYAELNYGDSTTRTIDHDWHIHSLQVGDDMLASQGRCSSVGPHYNPYHVSLVGDYNTACNSQNQFRCELGDLVGKHIQLNVRSESGKAQKYFFTDKQLPLSGPQSIIGKSVVIHDANSGGGRLSCGNVYEKRTQEAEVNSWSSSDPEATVTGNIKFSQDCTDTLSGMTHIKVDLAGLAGGAGGYHVHLYPTSGEAIPQQDRCQGVDVGGHFNPFSMPYPKTPGDTNDMYEIGDISGKFSLLSGQSYADDLYDMNLPMEGLQSIVGRSIVIHRNDATASRWVCGTIEDTTHGATKISAMATFDGENNGVSGTVYMTQYRYSNNDLSNTNFLVNLKYENGTQTIGHNWLIDKSHIEGRSCGQSPELYNPFMVSTGSSYSTECSMSNPLGCMVGDLSGKLGKYTIGSGKNFYTDVNADLEGRYSVMKRSIVIRHADQGDSPIACANILPYGRQPDTIFELRFLRMDHFSRIELARKVALSINTDEYNVQAEPMSSSDLKCSSATLYFLGPNASDLRQSFDDVIRGKIYANLKPFHPTAECSVSKAGILQVSLLMLLVSVIVSRLLKA